MQELKGAILKIDVSTIKPASSLLSPLKGRRIAAEGNLQSSDSSLQNHPSRKLFFFVMLSESTSLLLNTYYYTTHILCPAIETKANADVQKSLNCAAMRFFFYCI